MRVSQRNLKIVRAWFDGCFDLMHFGHVNALRLARRMCDELVVGIHSDQEIERNKRRPVMNASERYDLVNACRFVDHIVRDVPYRTSFEMMRAHSIDFAVHGDDMTSTQDGSNSYQELLDAGMMRYFPRTFGISSSDIVARVKGSEYCRPACASADSALGEILRDANELRLYEGEASTVASIAQSMHCSGAMQKVALVVGAFDILNTEDIQLLREAKRGASVLLAGIYRDDTGQILNFTERSATLAGCKLVDAFVNIRSADEAQALSKRIQAVFPCQIYWQGTSPYCGRQKIIQRIRGM